MLLVLDENQGADPHTRKLLQDSKALQAERIPLP